ncbi:MAG: trimethylamine methyltransferase, partial [Firmicutes bacterium]|nr:trimethylamine methyltransferase [Bacillota bacterium]
NYWVEQGCPTAENRATEAWKKRLEEYQPPELDKDQEKILDELLPKEYR